MDLNHFEVFGKFGGGVGIVFPLQLQKKQGIFQEINQKQELQILIFIKGFSLKRGIIWRNKEFMKYIFHSRANKRN